MPRSVPRVAGNFAVQKVTEGDGHVQEGWKVFPAVLKHVCTDLNETLVGTLFFERMLTPARIRNLQPRHQPGSWQLVSANVHREGHANVDLIVKRLPSPEYA